MTSVEHAVLQGQDVRFTFDSESNNWSFRVPSLNIVGGADTRQQAEGRAGEAIRFALSGNERPWRLWMGLGIAGVLLSLLVRLRGIARSH